MSREQECLIRKPEGSKQLEKLDKVGGQYLLKWIF